MAEQLRQQLVHPLSYEGLAEQWGPYYGFRPDVDFVIRMRNRTNHEMPRSPFSLTPELIFREGEADARRLWQRLKCDCEARTKSCVPCIIDTAHRWAGDGAEACAEDVPLMLAKAWDRAFYFHRLLNEHRPVNGALERAAFDRSGNEFGVALTRGDNVIQYNDYHTGYVAPFVIYVRGQEPPPHLEPLWSHLDIEVDAPTTSLDGTYVRPVGRLQGDVAIFLGEDEPPAPPPKRKPRAKPAPKADTTATDTTATDTGNTGQAEQVEGAAVGAGEGAASGE